MDTPHLNPVIQRFYGCRVLLVALILLIGYADSAPAGDDMSDTDKYRRIMQMYAEIVRQFPQVKDIDSPQAVELVSNSDVVFVDVRLAKEQAISMIPGAVSKKAFMDQLERYRAKRVIVYCTIGYRSAKMADKLKDKGIDATNLKAGILGWTHAGGALVNQNRPVEKMHVFGRKWDLAPAGFQTFYFWGVSFFNN